MLHTLVRPLLPLVVALVIIACDSANAALPAEVVSPDGHIGVQFHLDEQQCATLEITRRNTPIATVKLGLEFAETGPLRNFKIVAGHSKRHDESYRIAVGKASVARDHHEELTVSLVETVAPQRKLDIVIRAFDDAVAFRYAIPKQQAIGKFILTDESTVISFAGNLLAHTLPLNSFTTSYEKYYETAPLLKIEPQSLLGLPLLLERQAEGSNGLWLAVTEADLTNYAGMYLSADPAGPGRLVSKLAPLPDRHDGAKVRGTTPFASPWRIIMIADDPGRLIESNVVFNLSAPSQIEDSSWIKPGKTTFPWWNGYVLEDVNFEPGVNTATMKHYIDFCAEQGIPYHSLDGLDIAWYGGPIHPEGPTDVTKAAASIDMPELLRYAKEKGVRLRLWMHWKALKPQIDEAFRTYEEWGIEGVMVDFMDRDDQEMVQFYHEMAEKAARRHLTLTLHGAYKPTGMERTWPNVLTYEAALNQEYNKWQPPGIRGTPPRHNLDIAFIRMLAGPLDYHQGGMRNVLPENYQWRDKAPPVQGTRGHQLAMYVIYQNHLPMMADYPSAYRGEVGLSFMVGIPASWDETRVLHAEFGKCLVIARRKGDRWYLGGMTAEEARDLEIKLDFAGEGSFKADLFLDDPNDVRSVRHADEIVRQKILRISMPPSGGFAGQLVRISK